MINNDYRVLTNNWYIANDFLETDFDGKIYFYDNIKQYIQNNNFINKKETIDLITERENIRRYFFFKHTLHKYIVY